MKAHQRAWQRMLSGRRLDLLDPSPFDIEIEDIAHGLSFVARWNGQTSGDYPYSVAAHSVLVEKIFTLSDPKIDQKWRRAALLHDAAEYVIGDAISPVKPTLGNEYRALEKRLEAAINLRFGLPAVLPPEISRRIKRADRQSAWLEATNIAGFSVAEANKLFGRVPASILAFELELSEPKEARAAFLTQFQAVMA